MNVTTNIRRGWLAPVCLSCLAISACAGTTDTESTDSTDSTEGAGGPAGSGANDTGDGSGGPADSTGGTSGGGETGGPATPDEPGQPGADGCKLGAWQGNAVDLRAPSADPPCELTPEEVPMFVVLGWDDNGEAAGMDWSVELAADNTNSDGSAVHFTYYNTSVYAGGAGSSWKASYDTGHEIGNHTINHNTSNETDAATWEAELQGCHDTQVDLGISSDDIYGFRTPFLSHNDDTISTVQSMNYWYDCSLEEGYQSDQDGTNFLWPYTLDGGSPGNDLVADEWGSPVKGTVESHPGLWEMPVYTLMVPDDDACVELGIDPGLQQRVVDNIMASESWTWEPPKITGFDYNLWYSARLTREEFTAVLKHTLNLRLAGNRAPLLIGTHSSYYVAGWDGNSPNATADDRRAAVADFVEYATGLSSVRMTTAKATLDWIRNPEAL